jgi:hypothetical protein
LVILAGCVPKDADDLQVSETTETSSEESGDPLPACPAAGPVTEEVGVGVDFPGRDDVDPEAHASERDATCMLVDASAHELLFELQLVCDELDGALQQPYTITFESLQVPTTELFSPDSPIELSYRWWYGFEVGGGSRLSLAQDGEVRLLGYGESALGVSHACATPDDSLRARAEEWLAPIDTRIESAACEDESMLRLARMAENGEAYAYPGEIVEFDDGVTTVVGQASCAVDGEYDFWDFRVVAWR